MIKSGPSLTRRLDAWAEGLVVRRFPRSAGLNVRTLYRYLVLPTTLAWLVLRITRWGPRELRVVLGGLALWLLAVLLVDQIATQVRRRRKQL